MKIRKLAKNFTAFLTCLPPGQVWGTMPGVGHKAKCGALGKVWVSRGVVGLYGVC